MRLRQLSSYVALAAAAILGVATLAACSSSKNNSGGGSGGGSTESITIGSANFPESTIIAYMYNDALKAAGIKVSVKPNIGAREVYMKALVNKEIDLVPEYVSTVAEYWNTQINGKDASTTSPIGSTDAQATDNKLKALVAPKGLTVGPPSPAADQNAFAVTKDFADKNGLKTIGDLAKLNGQLVLGAGPECATRPFCEPGLEKTYGLKFKTLKTFQAPGGADTYAALKDGTIQVGLVFSSDGGVAANNLVVLDDDKHLQQADNIIWMGLTNKMSQKVQDVLNKVNAALTTSDLQGLNKQVGIDHADPHKVATQWVKDHNLDKS
jgi:osmoprotectant transport system substrate-binding protein